MLQKRTILLSIISLLFLYGCGSADETKQSDIEEKPLAVKVHTLKKELYPIWIRFTGKTEAIDDVDVIARVSGELESYHFKPGQKVKKDDLLFSIDKSEYQTAWDQKNAKLQKDKASYALAMANVRRYTPLVKEQLAPKEKLDELSATLKELEADITADKAALKRAALDLAYCDIRASIDGQIGKPYILPGNLVKTGDVLAKIVQAKELYVNFSPSAHEVALIKKYGKAKYPKVKVHIRGDKKVTEPLYGKIDFIDNISNSSTGTVAMRAIVQNDKELIFPGTFVEIALYLGGYKALAVDPDQISHDQLGEYVYVVNAQNTITKKYIKSFFSNNELVLVGDSLKEGDRVVVGTVSGLAEGSKVTLTETTDPVKVQ
ncbi:efflux RND transporter periplasmic adaptor subunit [Sulfurovum sp.]|uniref:efflux RND transporter periplasmic adaptor subunit n=1 Tax=Sulfurovum sp. TaxID=1969726 RepID=UPI0025EAA985|nr:efflux RND transporter periplasmic adaptor subunit [Sulfurovum sp.]